MWRGGWGWGKERREVKKGSVRREGGSEKEVWGERGKWKTGEEGWGREEIVIFRLKVERRRMLEGKKIISF